MNIAILIGSMVLWGYVHSALASQGAKDFVRRLWGDRATRVYRLGYNIFAMLSFGPILWLMRVLPDHDLFAISPPWLFLMLAGQGLSAFCLLIILLQTDLLSFVGLRQLDQEEKSPRLVTGGFYGLVRHPLYLFGLLMIWLTPRMTINMLVLYVFLTTYILVGVYFEENKLLREFGPAYAAYKSRTPMLVPGLVFSRNK
jgi:protein-S-isoprenylcysteine O-methyltransferase Ste14